MTTNQIIEEIKHLSPREQAEVIRFTYRLDAERRFSGQDVSALSKRFVDTADPAEAMLACGTIVRGFYGGLTPATN